MNKETVLKASEAIKSLVTWEFCDCGCPEQRSPAGPEDCDLLRLASYIRVNFIPEEIET